MIAQEIFLTKGVGKHREKLASFEMALRDAGIAQCNLVRVSSIFPPYCRIIPKKEGLRKIKPGQIVFCVLADIATNEPNRLVAASVGVAIPKDRGSYGYLSEHHAYGETRKTAGDYAEDLAAEMLATALGVDVNSDLKWDEQKEEWNITDKIVTTTNMTQTDTGDQKRLWTTVLAAAVFVM